jgi:hypothetical protein
MRERAWADADLRREDAVRGGRGRSWLARLLGR